MTPSTKLLDDLLARWVTPVFSNAGFRKSGQRRYLVGHAPDNLVLVQFRLYPFHPHYVGFYIEWAVIPAAVCDFQNRDKARPARPAIPWGMIVNRVGRPEEIATKHNPYETGLWVLAADGGLDTCGAVLERLLTAGGQLRQWQDMTDRDHVLRLFDEAQAGSSMGPFVPTGWPWRYLAMYINDGDHAQLDAMLTQLEQEPPPDWKKPWVVEADQAWIRWWRQRLAARLAEVGHE